eukprot:17949-Prorocentrum_minimum.AAC.3
MLVHDARKKLSGAEPGRLCGRNRCEAYQLIANRRLQGIGIWSRRVLTHQRALMGVCQIHLQANMNTKDQQAEDLAAR